MVDIFYIALQTGQISDTKSINPLEFVFVYSSIYFWNKLPNRISNSNSVKDFKTEFDACRNNDKKKNLRSHFGNYWMNYSTKFDLYIDIVLIVYIFCANVLFSFLFLGWCKKNIKKGRCPRRHNKQIIC